MHGYERGLAGHCATDRGDATIATAGPYDLSLRLVPKGFFPQQGHRAPSCGVEAAQDISYKAIADRQSALARIVMQDPAVDAGLPAVGAARSLPRVTNAMFINLKPARSARRRRRASFSGCAPARAARGHRCWS